MANDTAKIQAEKILKGYGGDYNGLANDECVETGFSKPQCKVLVGALAKGVGGEITTKERAQLKQAGFAKEFITIIAGVDGKAALWRRTMYFTSEVQSYISGLKDSERRVRVEAARALSWIADPAAVPALMTALEDPDWEVRGCATMALGEIADPAAIPALIKNPDGSVYGNVEWALDEILIKNGLMALIPYLRDLEQMVAGKDPECNEACQIAAAQILQKLDEEMR